jgi:hypothetical protein
MEHRLGLLWVRARIEFMIRVRFKVRERVWVRVSVGLG